MKQLSSQYIRKRQNNNNKLKNEINKLENILNQAVVFHEEITLS